MLNRKSLTLALVLTLLVVSVAAAQTIEFWTVDLSPTFNDYINGMIAEFEAKNPGVRIDWQDVPFSAMQQRLLTAYAGRMAPDVVNLNQEMVSVVGDRGALVDLKQYISEDELAQYSPGLIEAYTNRQGQLLALPWYSSGSVSFYNEEILNRAGVSDIPTNYDELYETIKTVYEKTGIQGYFPILTARRFIWALQKEGIAVLDETGTKAVFNTPEAAALLERARELVQMGAIPRETVGNEIHRELVDLYASEQIWNMQGATMLPLVKENNPRTYEKTVVSHGMMGKTGHPDISSGWALAVTTQSSAPQVAADWVVFVTNTENLLRFTELASIMPTRPEAAELMEPKFDDPLLQKATELQVEQMRIGRVYDIIIPRTGELFEILEEQIVLVCLEGKNAQQALDEVVAEWNRILSSV